MKYVKFLLLRKKQQEIFETVVSLLLGNKVVEGDCLFEYEKRFHDSILTTYLGCGGEITDVDLLNQSPAKAGLRQMLFLVFTRVVLSSKPVSG